MVKWETYQAVWDWVRLAHNPEVAGSNLAPATNAPTTEGPDQWFGLSAYEFVECDRQPPSEPSTFQIA